MPFAPSSFLFLVVMPGASSSFLAPSSDALRSSLTRTAFVADGELRLYCVDHGDLFLLEPDLPESEICNSNSSTANNISTGQMDHQLHFEVKRHVCSRHCLMLEA